MPAERPSIYDYLDHRAYLRDWFTWKKEDNPRYSHRAFSRAVGSKNPSLLMLIGQGKRNISAALLPAVLKALKLTAEEARFFKGLIELEQAPDDAARRDVWHQLSATKRFREARHLEAHSYDYLSHWYIPATRELAQLPKFRLDAGWVAKALSPTITKRQAQQALDVLLALDMLTPDDTGGASPNEGSVVTPHEVARLAVINYHQGMIDLARASVERHVGSERHIGAVTAAIPRALLPELKAEIARFQERVLHLCDDAAHEGLDAVYQFNMQLFPLSQLPEEP